MEYLNWDSLQKDFYLLDTFSGIDERYISQEEHESGIISERNSSGLYNANLSEVKENFSQWKNVKIIPGAIPETLSQVEAKKIAYLHIDMNCVVPEVAAFDCFWERLVPGAFVLLDDYAYKGHEMQKYAMDKAVGLKNLKIVSLPTGQGLVIKNCCL
jgi:hypothetical protein